MIIRRLLWSESVHIDIYVTRNCDMMRIIYQHYIEKLKTQMPVRFQIAEGDIILGGACFSLDTASGRIVGTEQITRRYRVR